MLKMFKLEKNIFYKLLIKKKYLKKANPSVLHDFRQRYEGVKWFI